VDEGAQAKSSRNLEHGDSLVVNCEGGNSRLRRLVKWPLPPSLDYRWTLTKEGTRGRKGAVLFVPGSIVDAISREFGNDLAWYARFPKCKEKRLKEGELKILASTKS